MDNNQPPQPNALSDEALLQNFIAGDRSALGELASRYEQPLLGLAQGLLQGNPETAKDAVQNAWLKVIRYAKSFDEKSSFKTWMYRIVINTAKDELAKRKKHKARAPLIEDAIPSPSDPSTDSDEQQDSLNELRHAVTELPEDRQRVILLCYHAGMTLQQAADILNIPIGTLKSRLSAALKDLRTRLRTEATT